MTELKSLTAEEIRLWHKQFREQEPFANEPRMFEAFQAELLRRLQPQASCQIEPQVVTVEESDRLRIAYVEPAEAHSSSAGPEPRCPGRDEIRKWFKSKEVFDARWKWADPEEMNGRDEQAVLLLELFAREFFPASQQVPRSKNDE